MTRAPDTASPSSGRPGSLEAPRFDPTRDVLDNGLVLLHQENPASPAVYASLRIVAGAVFDADDTAGRAHFVARMLNRGSQARSKREIGEVLDFTGAHLGGRAGRHMARIGAKARVEDFDEILSLMAEVVVRPSFPDGEVEKLRGELITAIREDADDPARVAVDRFREAAYPAGHPYGRRKSGIEETVAALDRDGLVSFHSERYLPGRAALAVVGNVDREVALAAAETAFGDWACADGPGGGVAASLPEVPDAPAPDEVRRLVEAMPEKSQVDVALGHPGIRRLDADYYACAVMNTVLGRFAMGGRLGRSVREEQGMAYYTYSSLQATVGPGPFLVRAGVHPDNVERAVDSIVTEIERMIEEPVGEAELEDAKSSLVRSVPRSLESNEGMASLLQAIEQYDLGLDYLERYPDLVEEVGVEEVRTAASAHLHPDRHVVVVAGPPPRA